MATLHIEFAGAIFGVDVERLAEFVQGFLEVLLMVINLPKLEIQLTFITRYSNWANDRTMD